MKYIHVQQNPLNNGVVSFLIFNILTCTVNAESFLKSICNICVDRVMFAAVFESIVSVWVQQLMLG